MPLRFGGPEEFGALRSALIDLNFTEKAICARTGIADIGDFKAKVEGRPTGTGLNDSLDVLIHLLMDGEKLPEAQVRDRLPSPAVALLESTGVLARYAPQPDLWYGTVALYPVDSLYIVSDRTVPLDLSVSETAADVVYAAITENTRRFMASLPESPCESFLDLCSGSGIAALAAASRYARHAWSCDLVERCVEFAEFSRRLNGIANATVAQGDLYQAVGDATFDRIVAHPPYVPAVEQKVLFRDGGSDGEQVLRGIVEGLPRHLRPGGRFYGVSLATDREGETLEQRIRKWLGGHQQEFDVVLVGFEIRTKPESQKPQPQKRDPQWEFLDRLQVKGFFRGVIVIERLAEVRPVATSRTRKAELAANEAVEWFVRWSQAAASPGFEDRLLQSRPRLAPWLQLAVTHVVDHSALVPGRFELRSVYPFTVTVACPGYVAMSVGACDGVRTALEIFEDLKRQEVLDSGMTPRQFAADLLQLVSHAFLEIEEFPLPEPRAVPRPEKAGSKSF
jgi:SAM-dependent methyltransferase